MSEEQTDTQPQGENRRPRSNRRPFRSRNANRTDRAEGGETASVERTNTEARTVTVRPATITAHRVPTTVLRVKTIALPATITAQRAAIVQRGARPMPSMPSRIVPDAIADEAAVAVPPALRSTTISVILSSKIKMPTKIVSIPTTNWI
jgi:hypothetical protein